MACVHALPTFAEQVPLNLSIKLEFGSLSFALTFSSPWNVHTITMGTLCFGDRTIDWSTSQRIGLSCRGAVDALNLVP